MYNAPRASVLWFLPVLMLSVYTWGYFWPAYIRRSNVFVPAGSGRYSFSLCPFTLNSVLFVGSTIITTPCGKMVRTMNGPYQRVFSFPAKIWSLELYSRTLSPGAKFFRFMIWSWKSLVLHLVIQAWKYLEGGWIGVNANLETKCAKCGSLKLFSNTLSTTHKCSRIPREGLWTNSSWFP